MRRNLWLKPDGDVLDRVVSPDLPIGGTADPEDLLRPDQQAEIESLRKREVQAIQLRHHLLPVPDQSGNEEEASDE